MNALIYSIVELLHTIISLYIIIVIISAFVSFVRPDPYHPLVQALYKLTEPLYSIIRKNMPFVVIGGIDLSPLIIVLGLQFIDTFMMRAVAGL